MTSLVGNIPLNIDASVLPPLPSWNHHVDLAYLEISQLVTIVPFVVSYYSFWMLLDVVVVVVVVVDAVDDDHDPMMADEDMMMVVSLCRT